MTVMVIIILIIIMVMVPGSDYDKTLRRIRIALQDAIPR